MKVSCPTCGRGTEVEAEIGDFPTRCQRCGGLLRRPALAEETGTVQRGLSLRRVDPPGAPSARSQRGVLSGMLSARQDSDEGPTVMHTGTATAVAPEPAVAAPVAPAASPLHSLSPAPPPQVGVLRPESRREITRAAARQKALRRAQLRGNHQALGALGWVGLALVAILGVSALFLKAHTLWEHGQTSSADTFRTQ